MYTRRTQEVPPEQSQQSQSLPTSSPEKISTSEPVPDPQLSPPEANQSLELPIAQRKGIRSCTSHPTQRYVSYSNLSTKYRACVTALDKISIPDSVYEAMKVPEWKFATLAEYQALQNNGTWILTQLPPGKRMVGCRWLYSVKQKVDGSIDRYKARLVAKGYSQSYGIDYQETFAPVAKLNTIRVLLSIAANQDWPLFQLDVKNAFLNGDLNEEVYMDVPPGFESEQTKGKVCRLKKALYGLKQSPRAWFERFTRVLKLEKYSQSQADHTLFYKHSNDGRITIIIVYVDDIVLTGNNHDEAQRLKGLISREFEVKDLGHLRYFLGLELARSTKGISVSQRKYVVDLLHESGMSGCRPIDTPMDPNTRLMPRMEEAAADKGQYQRLVGKLIYLTHTRPDISFSVSRVSQFLSNPSVIHMEAVIRILRYLKADPGKGLMFTKSLNRAIEVYTDADWAGSPSDRKSTSGMCSYVWGNLVTWQSKKQHVVARSSAESEFRAVAQGICEGIWLDRLLKDLKIATSGPIHLMCDNQSAIAIAKNPVHHDRTKHVEIDRHFISEKLESNLVKLSYVPSKQQAADILTKALFRPNFTELISKLGLTSIYRPV